MRKNRRSDGGGVTDLAFGKRRIGVSGGELDLRSPGYDGVTDLYDVAVTGGANALGLRELKR